MAAELASNLAEKQALLTQATLDLTKILAEKEKGLRTIQESTTKMEGIVIELDKYKVQVQNILGELNDLRGQAKEARARVNSESEGRTMEWNIVDKTLTDTLEGLKIQYPNLADAFAAIE